MRCYRLSCIPHSQKNCPSSNTMRRHEESTMKLSRKPFASLVTAAAVLLLAGSVRADLTTDVQHLQQRWAEVNYQLEGNTQLSAFEQLVADADKIVGSN